MTAKIVLGLIFSVVVFFAGRQSKTCPAPPDATPIIQEVEVIKEIDKPVIKEVEKRVEIIVKQPFYAGDCLDADGVRALNDLVKGTTAGRTDPKPSTPKAN